MNYHYEDGNNIEFKTNVIPKIIDYGRSFTSDTDNLIHILKKMDCFNTLVHVYDMNNITSNNEVKEYFIKNGCNI